MIDTQAIKNKILDLAMRGQLTEQLPEDGTAEELYQQIQAEKQTLVKSGKLKKEKPFPPITEDETPYSIPDNWKWVRIGSILTLQSGKNITASDIKSEPDEDHDIPCYGGNGPRGYVSQPNVDGFHAIIGRQGALCGNINFAEGPFYATEHAVVVYEYAETDMNWAGLMLRFLNLNQYATSVAQPGLAVNKIEKVPMPLAPLAEQQRIVEKIDQAFSVLDIIDTLQEQYANNLTTLKAKLIDAAIQGKLTEQLPEDGTAEELYEKIQEEKQALIKAGKIKKEKPLPEIREDETLFEIPKNWKWIRWGDIVNIVSARRVHKADWRESGVPFYRAREIAKLAEDGFVQNDLFISEELFSEFSKTGVPKENDLMVSAVGTLGRTYVVKSSDRFYYKDASVLCFENFGNINPYFLAFAMKSEMMRRQIDNNSGGTTVDTLTMVRMIRYLLALPPLAEQNRIVTRLNEILRMIEA